VTYRPLMSSRMPSGQLAGSRRSMMCWMMASVDSVESSLFRMKITLSRASCVSSVVAAAEGGGEGRKREG